MRRMHFAIFTLLLGFCSTVDVACADDAANAWKALRAGGHVALMRHADAPGGVGDPPGFRVEDCATQRNLSAKGRADADVSPPYVRIEDNLTWWAVGATIAVPAKARWDLGLSAILEEQDGTKSYWAIAHPPGDKPDFHDPACFAAHLP